MSFLERFMGSLLIGALLAITTIGICEAAIAIAEDTARQYGRAQMFRLWGGSAILASLAGMVGTIASLRYIGRAD